MNKDISLISKQLPVNLDPNIKPSILLLSTIIFIIFLTLSILVGLKFIYIPFLNYMDLILLCLFGSILPYGIYMSKKIIWIRKLEHEIPNFLKDVAESNSSGLTIYNGIRTASKGNYGPFTPELKKVNSQLSWGISLTDALDMLVVRVQSNMLTRAVILIKEASRSGGETSKVLRAAAVEAEQIEMTKKARETNMAIYIAIVYVSFFVFVMIIAVLNFTLIPQFSGSQVGLTEMENVESDINLDETSNTNMDVQAIYFGLYSIAIVQALGDGLVCGQLLKAHFRF